MNPKEIVRRLNGHNATLYGKDTCPWTVKQKEIFKNFSNNINYVDCDNSASSCMNKEIQAVPTWIIRDDKFEGFNDLESLDKILLKIQNKNC